MVNELHSFDKGLAEKIGLYPAIVYWYIGDSIEHEQYLRCTFQKGRYWVFGKQCYLLRQFPYMTDDNLASALKTLLKHGYIEKAKFDSFEGIADWYTIARKETKGEN